MGDLCSCAVVVYTRTYAEVSHALEILVVISPAVFSLLSGNTDQTFAGSQHLNGFSQLNGFHHLDRPIEVQLISEVIL